MLLVGPKLRVIHVSTHVSLKEAIRRVTKERVNEAIDLADESCHALGIPHPRIAVAGLNPHAREGGLFGDEEERQIVPAIGSPGRAVLTSLIRNHPTPSSCVPSMANLMWSWQCITTRATSR